MPKQYQRPDICPCLTYNDAQNSIEWLCKVFGFEKRLAVMAIVLNTLNLSFGNGVVMVSSPKQEDILMSPKQLPALARC